MTPREVINNPTIRLVVFAVLIGIAWGELRVSVAQKADRSEVAASAAALHTEVTATAAALAASTSIAAEQQAARIVAVANDVTVIKAILCQQANRDSFCHGP